MADDGSTNNKRKKSGTSVATPPEKRGRASSTSGATSSTHSSHSSEAASRPVRVYCDGIYDLFHPGHARSLEQAKQLFPNVYLLVGVCNDKLTHSLKGKTVMHDFERYEAVRHCRWADEVVEDAPWIITQQFIDLHQIDYVAHGEDIILDENGVDIYKFVKDQGKYCTIKRTEGVSTSDIILRIVKDYDSYVRRNLKRGYTREQLGVSFMKEKTMKMEEQLSKINEKVRNEFAAMKNNLKEKVDKVNQKVDLANWNKLKKSLLSNFIRTFDWTNEGIIGQKPALISSSSDSDGDSSE